MLTKIGGLHGIKSLEITLCKHFNDSNKTIQ